MVADKAKAKSAISTAGVRLAEDLKYLTANKAPKKAAKNSEVSGLGS